jgi:mRNA-degrading endonuclease RelE of RelBE toxin-antitoxin system
MFDLEKKKKVNNDIISVLDYSKNVLEAPMAAESHSEEIKKKYDKLKENPYIRPLVQNKYLAKEGIRFIKVKNYMLIYKINKEDNTVLLYRFLYCKRDWINILTTELKITE